MGMEDDPISQLFKRLALDMPELMEEVVAFIERRTADLNEDDSAAPRSAESVASAVLAPTPQDDAAGKLRSPCSSTPGSSPASMPMPSG
jgi:hypothetical protein